MKTVRSVYFIKSAVTPEQYPHHHLPEIAFIGRSNVGKSSLLNTLVNKKNLAYISNTPGRTQIINFFNIDDKLCFVDLPGYGYAKVPQAIKDQWQPMIESYLAQSENLRSVILLVDSRHTPTKHDLVMRDWLIAYHIPMIVVATKIDKIPKTKRPKQIAIAKKTLKLQPTEHVFPFSALTKEGIKPIWDAIFDVTASQRHDRTTDT
jgi:GTP-binding protein